MNPIFKALRLKCVCGAVVLLLLALASSPLHATTPDDILNQFEAEMQKLHSFQYHATLDTSTSRNGQPPKHSARYETYCLQDNLTNQSRRKYCRPKSAWCQLIQDPQDHIFVADNGLSAVIDNGVFKLDDWGIKPFDAWAAPLEGVEGILQGVTAERALKVLRSLEAEKIEQRGSRYTVDYRPKVPEPIKVVYRITWDSALGMMPVEFQNALEIEPGVFREPLLNRAVTTWTKVNGAYVPEGVESMTSVGPNQTRLGVVTVKWQMVNEVVDAKEFTLDALDLPAGIHVVNNKLGVPVVERIVGMDIPAEIFAANQPTTVIHRGTSSRTRGILMLGAVALLVMIGVWLVRKRGSITG